MDSKHTETLLYLVLRETFEVGDSLPHVPHIVLKATYVEHFQGYVEFYNVETKTHETIDTNGIDPSYKDMSYPYFYVLPHHPYEKDVDKKLQR